MHAEPVSDGVPVAALIVDGAGLLAALTRHAKSRIRNPALAEDAVSETLLAALESGRRFASAAQGRAWMYAVLGHKLVDQLRLQGRETPAGDLTNDGLAERPDWDGGTVWCVTPGSGSEPEQACAQRQLVDRVLQACDALPPAQRHAFMMRELRDADAASICRQLGVNEGHLWVLLHRARRRLRALLDLAAADGAGSARAGQ
jgi:RNA polymerase sigma-70 factor (ECF subfamily)